MPMIRLATATLLVLALYSPRASAQATIAVNSTAQEVTVAQSTGMAN